MNLLSPSHRHDFSTFRENHLNINQCWISWKFSQFTCRQCKSKPTPLKHVFTYRLNGILCYIRCTLFMGEFTQFYTSIESRGCQIFALDSAFTVICKYLRKICFIFIRKTRIQNSFANTHANIHNIGTVHFTLFTVHSPCYYPPALSFNETLYLFPCSLSKLVYIH